MRMFERILRWAEEQQLLVQRGEDDIVFQVNGQSGSWLSRVKALEEDGLLIVLCAYPFRVPPEKRAEAALTLDQLSSHLKLGAFSLDGEDGQISFRLSQLLWPDDGEETDRRLRSMILLAMSATDSYYRKMLALAAEDAE